MIEGITTRAPKVSVLVPVYDGEKYLPECLDSVLAQDFDDMEILISDDDSSDNSRELILNYARRDRRIRWWKNPRRLGLTANSNFCLRAARGEYIKFVHQDDKLLSSVALKKMFAALESHPSAVLACSHPHLTGSKFRPPLLFHESGFYDGHRAVLACLERNANLIGCPTLTLFRASPARRGFDERFTGIMDLEMWCHLLEQGGLVYLAEPLATWRIHECQQTARIRAGKESSLERLLLMEIHYAKPWLRKAATPRLLFLQAYYLRKKYGRSADELVGKLMADLPARSYLWQWLKHKAFRPFQKTFTKLCVITQLNKRDLNGAWKYPDQKRILVIDAAPLTPQRDSGSLRMFHLLQVFVQMGFETTFISKNLEKSDCTEALKSLGVQNPGRRQINNPAKFLKRFSAGYGYVILSRPAAAKKYMGLLKEYAPETKIIYDTVDLHYLRIGREAQIKNNDALKIFAGDCKKRELTAARKADATLVVSPVEKEILEKECPGVRVGIVSNIQKVHGRGADFSSRRDLLFIGSFLHSPNIDAVTFFVRDIFPQIQKRLPEVRFHILGGPVPDAIIRLSNRQVCVHGFVGNVEPFFNSCKLSVAPIRFGAGIKGKINLSQSYGVPVVATSLAAEGMRLESGTSALIADTPETFARAVVELYTDEVLWNRLSENGIKNLEQYFSFEAARANLEEIFNRLSRKTTKHA